MNFPSELVCLGSRQWPQGPTAAVQAQRDVHLDPNEFQQPQNEVRPKLLRNGFYMCCMFEERLVMQLLSLCTLSQVTGFGKPFAHSKRGVWLCLLPFASSTGNTYGLSFVIVRQTRTAETGIGQALFRHKSSYLRLQLFLVIRVW